MYLNKLLTGILPKRKGLKYKTVGTKIGSIKYFFYFSVCLCRLCMCACVWRGQRSTTGCIHLQKLSTLFLETGSLISTWGLQIRIGWVASESQGCTCVYLLSAEVTSVILHSVFHVGIRVELRSSYLLGKHFADWAIMHRVP